MQRELIDAACRSGPDAVAALLEAQAARIAELTAEVEELKRLIGRNSNNSSMPPSRDSPQARKERSKKKASGRKQGGQKGHPGHHRPMVADPDRIVEHWPAACSGCGAAIGEHERVADDDPVCHQVSEIHVQVSVTEHRRRRACCAGCGKQTLAELPAGVPAGAFGPAVAAAAAALTAARVSRRDVARLLEDLCGVKLGPASVEALVKQASAALEDAYVEILAAVDASPVKCADETGWRQGAESRWLSVAAGQQAALFQIAERRDRDATRALLGDQPAGVIVSDRYAVYLYVPDGQRQLCLAHVLRDLVAWGERDGAPGRIGRELAACLAAAFKTLHQPGRDPADLAGLQADIKPHQQRLRALLEQGANGNDAKFARFCEGLLAHFDALWTFTRIADVPATNNTAERALRHGVLWRKTSHGTQTDHGDRLVERLLTMRETCRLQGRRLHSYLTDVITASLNGQPIPTPLPP
jgi:transposase